VPDPATGYLAVARIVGSHGTRGEVRCEVITDFPERFKRTKRLYGGDEHIAYELERSRLDHRGVVLKLAGVDDRATAERLRGQTLFVPEDEAVQLPPDTYFWHQVIGLEVRTADGRDLGKISEILQTGSNDVYVVAREGKELLLPAIQDVVREIDLASGTMTVELLEGLEP
jgi:16S rRNA processing protein RimM